MGKTRSLAIATLKLCLELEGEKDEGGLYAKIVVGGYTYAHLEQTFLIDFRAYLDTSKTPYHEDTKNHIFTVGTVQVILVQLLEPGKIFGQSVYACIVDESDELPEDVMIEAMKSLSQRCRQIMPNHRAPFLMSASTAQGMKGFYRLYCHYKKSGIGFVLIRARTQDNWYLPKEYIIDLWKNFTEVERKVYMEGQFLSVSQGRVIPGFDWDRNFVPESDMDLELRPGERVYIGQDFNCTVGETLVSTIHGPVMIKDIKVGDYVLTRQGYKKVLTSKCQGVRMVYDFNGITGTKDHIAITPQGEKTLWEAKNFYYLKEQYSKEQNRLQTALAKLFQLKSWIMTDFYGNDGLKVLTTHDENTLQQTIPYSISTCIESIVERYLKAIKSTTKMDTMTTGLRALSACLRKSIDEYTWQSQDAISVKTFGSRTEIKCSLLIARKHFVRNSVKSLRKLGLKEHTLAKLCAVIVDESLQLVAEQLSTVLTVELLEEGKLAQTTKSAIKKVLEEYVAKALSVFVLVAENRLSEKVQQDIAKNIEIIGTVPATNEREAEVYDIEVEDAHEFFANGILVHNCGYNRGSAWVARNGTLHCIKRYDFPETDDMPNIYRYDFPDQDIFWLPDVTAHDQYPHFARDLRRNDIHIIHRSKSPLVEDSCFLISKLCAQGRIMIHSQAREVAEAFSTASRGKDNKIPKGVGPNSPIHDIDGARYVCSYLALILPEFKDIRKGIMSHLASFRAGAEEMEERLSAVAQVGAGYTRIEGRAFTENR